MKSYFSTIFGSSPIRPLQQHMEKVLECTQELAPLFAAVSDADFAAVAQAQERVARLEDEADALKKELRLRLPNSLFMPVDRRDLLELLRVQDKVANKAKDIAGLILGRQMQIPESMREDFRVFLQRCIDTVAQALQAVREMDELVETGFRGTEVDNVLNMIQQIDVIEKETDTMQVQLRRKLHALEPTLPPVDVMFLYKIIEWTGDLADLAQRVGSRLHLMLAK